MNPFVWTKWLCLGVSLTRDVAARWRLGDEDMARRIASGLVVSVGELERQSEQRAAFEALL